MKTFAAYKKVRKEDRMIKKQTQQYVSKKWCEFGSHFTIRWNRRLKKKLE